MSIKLILFSGLLFLSHAVKFTDNSEHLLKNTLSDIKNKAPNLSDVIRKPKSEHKNPLIYLHGLDGTGSDVMNIASSLAPQDSCKIICPTASKIKITSNEGVPKE